MTDFEAYQEYIQRRHNAFCKAVIRYAARDMILQLRRKWERQVSLEELTPTLLREFVEKIVIHESEALDGKRRGKLRRQEIEIYYSFVGKVELPD